MQTANDTQRMNPKQCRLLAGLNQPELAELAGVSQATVSGIEQGKNQNPSPLILEKLGLAIERRTYERNLANKSLPLVTYRDYVMSLNGKAS